MPLLITDLGAAAALDAGERGVKLRITHFAVGTATGYSPDRTQTGLRSEAYRGTIRTVEILSVSSLQLTCEVPATWPTSGTQSLSEIGMYLDSGVLFAVGTIQPRFPKEAGVAYRPIVTLTLGRCNELVEININTHQSLPYVPALSDLPSPVNSIENAAIVGDEEQYVSVSGAGLAIKQSRGAEVAEWAFAGHDLVAHRVRPDRVVSDSEFSMPVPYWWYPDERVIVQVVIGESAGQSRHFQWDAATTTLRLVGSDAFYRLTDSDELNVWRRVRIPDSTDVKSGWTLQVENRVPEWAPPGGRFPFGGYPIMGAAIRQTFTGDGRRRDFVLDTAVCNAYVAISGSTQHMSAYSMVGNTLLFAEPPCVGNHEVVGWVPTDATRDGVTATMYREAYVLGMVQNPGYGSDTLLRLETGPSVAAVPSMLVFHAHTFRPSWEYVYNQETRELVWNVDLNDGITEIIWFETAATDKNVCSVRKTGYVPAVGQRQFTLPVATTRESTLVFVQGGYLERSTYTVSDRTVTLAAAPVAGRPVEIWVFHNEEPGLSLVIQRGDPWVPSRNSWLCEATEGDLRTVSGVPQMFCQGRWVTLHELQKPHVVTVVTDGTNAPFSLGVVPRGKEHMRVNVGGSILFLSEFGVSGTSLTIAKDPPLPAGRNIEVIIYDYWA